MRRLTVTLLLIVVLAVMATGIHSTCACAQLTLQGSFAGDYRLYLQNEQEFSHAAHRLTLLPEARLGAAKFTGEFWLNLQGRPAVDDPSGLSAYGSIFPWNLEVREAYVELYDFPLDRMDLRAGRQLVPWGTGDLVSPTDNINPLDLADFKDFGRRLGSEALQLNWYPGPVTVTAVYVPVFTPARLPAGWMNLFLPPEMAGMLTGVDEGKFIVNLPAASLRESAFGLKLAGRIGGYDLSLSYLDGRYNLPEAKEVRGAITEIANPLNPMEHMVLEEVSLFFPRRRVVGLDFAGELGSAGIWAEAAVFFPEKVTRTTRIDMLDPYPDYTGETVVLEQAYTKYLVGADYTFPGGTYLNLQFLHGFPHERGAGELEDYLIFALEKTVLNGRVKITPLAGLLAVQDFSDIRNNYALVLAPEVSWYPVDGAEITLGVNWLQCAGDSLFSRFQDDDEVYLKFKYSF